MTFQWPVFSLPARVVPREDGKVFMPSWSLLRTAGRAERRCLVVFFKCFVALPAAVYTLPASVFALPAAVYALPASVFAIPAAVFAFPAAVVAFPASVFALPASPIILPAAVLAIPTSPIILPAAARRFANVKMGNTAFGFRRKM